MELIEFHFRAGLDFTGQFPGWCEVENLAGFGVGKTLDHAEEITKKENCRKRKSQIRMVKNRVCDSTASAQDEFNTEWIAATLRVAEEARELALGLDAGRPTKVGESWMPSGAGKAGLGPFLSLPFGLRSHRERAT